MPTRTLRIPIYSVDGDIHEFYNDLRQTLHLSRSVFNRMLTRCASKDTLAYDAYTKKEKIPSISAKELDCYSDEVVNFPGCAGVCACMSFKQVVPLYKQFRWEILRGTKSLPLKRSAPWSLLLSDGFKAWHDEDSDKWYVKIKLLNKRWTCELMSGSNYAKLIYGLKKAFELDEKCVRDSKIWIDKRKNHAIIGISVRFPQKSNDDLCGTLMVSTDRNSFLKIIKEKTEIPFVFNADHLRRWNAERVRKQQRLRQDKKYDRSCRKYITKKQEQISIKYKDRLQTFCHTVTKQIVDYAIRNKIAKVTLDITIKTYIEQFTWFDLKTKLQYKCEKEGIEFEEVTRTMQAPDLDEPHVYFVLATDPETKKSLGRIKIGKTTQKSQKRQKQLESMGGQDLVYLAAHKVPKYKLTKQEKEYHALFAEHQIGKGKKEWFKSEPIIDWLREVECLGNTGNLSQISQVLEVK